MKTNLAYFIYWGGGKLSHYHHLNLSIIKEHLNTTFNGEVVIKIAIDKDYDLSPITDLLPPNTPYQVVKNDRNLGEAVHFLDSLKQIGTGQTFYAHAKGISRPPSYAIDTWIKYMYKVNLVNIPNLKEQKKLFSGTCGKLIPCPPYVPESFHYSGSFYWVDLDAINLDINLPLNSRWLSERFPAIMARKDQCLFIQPYQNANPNYYQKETWDRLLNSKIINL